MDPDAPQTPREELEARVTALLLGELSPADEAVVREAIAKDPALAQLHARLRQTIGLVAEAARSSDEQAGASAPLPRLSAERRQKLLDSFNVVPPAKLRSARAAKEARREWLLVAAMIVGLLALVAVVIPNFVRARSAGPTADRGHVELLAARREFDEESTTPVSGSGVERSLGRVASSSGDSGIPKTPAVVAEQLAQKTEKTAIAENDFADVTFDSSRSANIRWLNSVGTIGGAPSVVQNPPPGGTAVQGFQIVLPKQAEPNGAGVTLYFRKPAEPSLTANGAGAASEGYFERPAGFASSLSEAAPGQRDAGAAFGQTTNAITSLASDSKMFGGGLGGFGRAYSGSQNWAMPTPTGRPDTSVSALSDLSAKHVAEDKFVADAIATPAPGGAVRAAQARSAGVDSLAEIPRQSELESSAPARGESNRSETRVGREFILTVPLQGGKRESGGIDSGKAVTDLQLQVAGPKDQRLAKKPAQLGYAVDDRSGLKQTEIVLPGTPQLAELEKVRVLTGPVAASDLAVNDPATKLPAFKPKVFAKELKEAAVEERKEIARLEPELLLRSRAKSRAPDDGAPVPQPEIATAENAFSTFSLNVSDVSFKLAAAALEQGRMPDAATVRSEEFINAFDYRDPEPVGGAPIGFRWERARDPFTHDRDVLRFSVKTAASGRQPGRPLNLVLLLDNSGSMERADRIRIRQECLRVLAGQLQPQDRVSVVAFARTARLWVDGLPGSQGGELPQRVGGLTPEGGTNLEDAMNLAYQTALRHFLAQGMNRVVLLTDGAANLGDVQPDSLRKKVETHRQHGIALDCFGIGWEGLNDELLEALSRNGDGRYGFVNTPEAAVSEFAAQLAGALKVAASDVKVQVEWNPRRVTAYRQIGYAKHQLKKEQFRDNTVDAAEIGAAEAGNAVYTVQVNPAGEGPLGVVRVRFKVPGTGDYREQEWPLLYDGTAKPLDQSTPSLRLAACASAFSEWLVSSPFAVEVTPDKLLGYLAGVPATYNADPRPKKLEWMIRQAGSVAGK